MNCLEARRQMLVDPSRPDGELREHLAVCTRCANDMERLLRLDEAIRRAMMVEPAPGTLERIQLVQVLGKRPTRIAGRLAGIAAILLLSLAVVFWTLRSPGSGESAPGHSHSVAVLEHIQSEIEYLQRDDQVSLQALNFMLSQFGARLRDNPGPVRYLGRCLIGESEGVHLVLEGATAPITVLLMPTESTSQPETLDEAGFRGVVVPAGPGSMAVVGGKEEPLDELVEKLGRALVWES